jgi:hypothetical protein
MVKDKIDKILAITDKDLLTGKSFFPSSSFSLTLEQIQWLKKISNKSKLVRLLVEGAMVTDKAEGYMMLIDDLEHQINQAIYEWRCAKSEYEKDELMEAIRDGQNRRRRIIGLLCNPPDYE